MIDFVKPSHVFLDCPAKDVDEALHFIADKAVDLGLGADADAIYKAFRAREDMGSTGMTDGFAIPHAMDPEIKETAVIVLKFADAPEWKTMDGQPVVYGSPRSPACSRTSTSARRWSRPRTPRPSPRPSTSACTTSTDK